KQGPAYDAGIRKGDVIMWINNIKIKGVTHFKKIIRQLSDTSVPVLVHRHGTPLFLPLDIPAK
ncbi:MAG: serine peptidase, partial [Candidatus Parabeggiatoa sp. nov. 1]